MHELTAIVHEVVPGDADLMSFVDSVFGRETGEPMLRRHFAEVEWRSWSDELVSHDPEVVLGHLCSFPPGEGATAERRVISASLRLAGAGTLRSVSCTCGWPHAWCTLRSSGRGVGLAADDRCGRSAAGVADVDPDQTVVG